MMMMITSPPAVTMIMVAVGVKVREDREPVSQHHLKNSWSLIPPVLSVTQYSKPWKGEYKMSDIKA